MAGDDSCSIAQDETPSSFGCKKNLTKDAPWRFRDTTGRWDPEQLVWPRSRNETINLMRKTIKRQRISFDDYLMAHRVGVLSGVVRWLENRINEFFPMWFGVGKSIRLKGLWLMAIPSSKITTRVDVLGFVTHVKNIENCFRLRKTNL